MFKRIILAADCSRQTLVALREGALMAQVFDAKAHLMIFERPDVVWATVDGSVHAHRPSDAPALLELGLQRLKRLGVEASGEIRNGDPASCIVSTAKRMRADLIIIGHRRQSFLERWWSGSREGAILDAVACSVMVARETVSDTEFESYFIET